MWFHILHQIGSINLFEILHRIVTHGVRVEALSNLFLNAIECTTADEKNIVRVYVNVVLVRVFAATFWGNIDNASFQEFKHTLLHTFSAHITRDGWVVALTRNFVDFVNENDTALSFFYIEIGHLEQTRENAFHVFAHISCFGEDCCIYNGERHFEELCNSASQERLTRTRRADHHNVAFLNFYRIVFVFVFVENAFVVIVDSNREILFCCILSDDVFIEVFFNLFGSGQSTQFFLYIIIRLLRSQGQIYHLFCSFCTFVADMSVKTSEKKF